MSLKTIHLIFVSVCLLLAFSLGMWFGSRFLSGRSGLDLVFAVGWLGVGGVLVAYGRYFLRKLQHTPYL
jgi:hypothetical protein